MIINNIFIFKIINKLKILFILFFSFLSIYFFSPIIFLANTPRINPRFITSIKSLPENISSFPGKIIANLSNFFYIQQKTSDYQLNQNQTASIPKPIQLITPPSYLEFKPVSKYVEAAEDEKTGNKYLKIKKGAKMKVVGTIEINGKTYPKIKIIEE